ncbi:hypothetical protein Pint_16813 [Pistacia integerrima]|uniref:Uncharacterized protein n=1 Tax=Pistacia integerrima TaxID=434235 RepID=A0ACC0ZC89_9ROSI|nr:hypothetical protein Pint_16813 [Pistacia integerrima]
MAPNFTPLVFILSCFCSVGATTIYIGGYKGWSPDSDISTIQARMGDVLVFSYTQDYDVEEVPQLLYTTCNTDSKKPNQVYNDDDTVISLTQPGDLYFISDNFCRTLRLYVYVDP